MQFFCVFSKIIWQINIQGEFSAKKMQKEEKIMQKVLLECEDIMNKWDMQRRSCCFKRKREKEQAAAARRGVFFSLEGII